MSTKTSSQTDWREQRRLQALKLHERGWQQNKIAEALGVSEGAVSQWLKKARTQGAESLHHQPPPGRPSKLSAEQWAQLPALLAKEPEAFGFRGQVWTTERVAQMIQQEFGVSYHPAHCSCLLSRIKHSQQKPIQKATQRDENAIQRWKDERYDALKKRQPPKSAPSFS
jgi:transposase